MDTDVLALDEPLAGLDPEGQEELCALLENLNSEGRTIIVVSHDSDVLGRRCKNAVVLENGRISDQKNPAYAPASVRIKSELAALGIGLD